MSDPDPGIVENDPWLTVAEIAEELRVNPATVRLWVSKGVLPAKRAGRRKLLIRRSDLDRMLQTKGDESAPAAARGRPAPAERDSARPPESIRRLEHAQPSDPLPPLEEAMGFLESVQLSDEAWVAALEASESAPPDPDFPHRLSALALAAEGQARSLGLAAQSSRLIWTPIENGRDITISHELRRSGNRPGPASLWADFDRCVQRLGLAMEGRELAAVASRYHDLATALHALVDALADRDLARRRRHG